MKTALRWLFAVLVLVNVGVFMWASWYRTPSEPPPQAPLPQLNPEKMVPLSAPGLEPKPPSPAAKSKVLAPVPLAQVKVALPTQLPSTQSPPIVNLATPAPVSKAKGPVPAPLAQVKVAPPVVNPTPPAPKCLTIGPFDTDKAVQDAIITLKADNVSYTTRSREKKEVSSYWVYLPPVASRHKAEIMLKQLDRLGIMEHVIVTERNMNNAISLGLYQKPENARTRLRQLAKKGLKARQEIRYRTRTFYWLDAEVSKLDLYPQLLSRDWGGPGVSAKDVACRLPPAPVAGSANSAPVAAASESDQVKKAVMPKKHTPLPQHRRE